MLEFLIFFILSFSLFSFPGSIWERDLGNYTFSTAKSEFNSREFINWQKLLASLGLIADVTWTLGRAALIDWLTVIVAIASAIAVFRFKVNFLS